MATQSDWRFCVQCSVLYFDGHADGNKGACSGAPAGQHGHRPAGYNFVLAHDVPASPTAQDKWRNCWKCQAMVFDGYPDKGHCAAGGAHEGHGNDPAVWNFVLPHPVNPKVTILTPNGAHVRIIGERFTPSGSVHFGIGYHDGTSTHTLEATATADVVTGRVETEFDMTSPQWARVSTHATDQSPAPP